MTAFRIPLRVVFYRDNGDWIAHCLEFNILGDGPTRETALENLSEAITIQMGASIEFNNPANLFSPAEGKYFAMFAAGKDVAKGMVEVRFRQLRSEAPFIDGVEAHEYDDCDSRLALT